ncbi:LptF/LptG family permease [Candidatus Pelagibacter sp.]|nr:LptF/LptG family permease [Candidatus Pelagibacter sp.]
MFKLYEKYLIEIFLKKFFLLAIIFFSLTFILGLLEEISFLKSQNKSFYYPYFLTLLNTPITLFEIFPFIFLLSTQFLFYDLFKKEELELLKKNGLKNTSIIKLLFIVSVIMGLVSVLIYYNFASTLKFHYSNIKNDLSKDNKYLAMVNNSGLWIKDEINNNILIVKSKFLKKNYLSEVIVNELDQEFNLIRVIQSKKVDISKNEWIVYNPTITKNNVTEVYKDNLFIQTNFNEKKIKNIFSNVSTLNLFQLFNMKDDFEKLGYSTNELKIYMLKLISMPIFYGLLSLISSIIMLNGSRNISFIRNIVVGILISVIIYYINFMFSSLGNTGKIPISISILFPIIIISIISIIGLVTVNEK